MVKTTMLTLLLPHSKSQSRLPSFRSCHYSLSFPQCGSAPRCGFQLGLEPTIISEPHTPVRTPMRVQTYGFTQRSQPTAQIHGLMDRDRLLSPDLSAPWVKLPPHEMWDPLLSVNLTNSKYSDFLIIKINKPICVKKLDWANLTAHSQRLGRRNSCVPFLTTIV